MAQFQQHLLEWYGKHGRSFPWRDTSDGYAVLVAEKLLQQTVVRQAVVDAYLEIMKRYPAPLELSRADPADIEPLIRPLGFLYRARELVAMAQAIMSSYGGQVPRSIKGLMALPGVGEYGARAVLSFAFGEPIAIVDTNVARLLYRLYGIPGTLPANPARKRRLVELADALLARTRAKSYNLAVLDLCAMICKPAKPRCTDCPVLAFCSFGRSRTGIDKVTKGVPD